MLPMLDLMRVLSIQIHTYTSFWISTQKLLLRTDLIASLIAFAEIYTTYFVSTLNNIKMISLQIPDTIYSINPLKLDGISASD